MFPLPPPSPLGVQVLAVLDAISSQASTFLSVVTGVLVQNGLQYRPEMAVTKVVEDSRGTVGEPSQQPGASGPATDAPVAQVAAPGGLPAGGAAAGEALLDSDGGGGPSTPLVIGVTAGAAVGLLALAAAAMFVVQSRRKRWRVEGDGPADAPANRPPAGPSGHRAIGSSSSSNRVADADGRVSESGAAAGAPLPMWASPSRRAIALGDAPASGARTPVGGPRTSATGAGDGLLSRAAAAINDEHAATGRGLPPPGLRESGGYRRFPSVAGAREHMLTTVSAGLPGDGPGPADFPEGMGGASLRASWLRAMPPLQAQAPGGNGGRRATDSGGRAGVGMQEWGGGGRSSGGSPGGERERERESSCSQLLFVQQAAAATQAAMAAPEGVFRGSLRVRASEPGQPAWAGAAGTIHPATGRATPPHSSTAASPEGTLGGAVPAAPILRPAGLMIGARRQLGSAAEKAGGRVGASPSGSPGPASGSSVGEPISFALNPFSRLRNAATPAGGSAAPSGVAPPASPPSPPPALGAAPQPVQASPAKLPRASQAPVGLSRYGQPGPALYGGWEAGEVPGNDDAGSPLQRPVAGPPGPATSASRPPHGPLAGTSVRRSS